MAKSSTPAIIFIIGLPAAGKSTLARRVAEQLRLPLVSKDVMKEIMFDTLGWSDREWSKKVGRAGFKLIDYVVEEQLKAGHSVIIETPLRPEFENKKFQAWQAKYNFRSIQVRCDADKQVLVERFIKRSREDRHPGHVDESSLDEYKAMLSEGAELLALKGAVIEVDTTDFSKLDEADIIDQIAVALRSPS